jgi:hypothetical protein
MAKAKLRPPLDGLKWKGTLGEDLNAGDPVVVYDDSGAKIKKVFLAGRKFCRVWAWLL